MESKGRRKRPADQLQGAVVQDQTVRSEPEDGLHAPNLRPDLSAEAEADAPIPLQNSSGNSSAQHAATELDMLVIQYGDRTVKGYTPSNRWPVEDPSFHTPPAQFQRLGSEIMEAVPLDGVKAIFFVKSFEGKSHEDLRFHDHLPAPDCLWVRATFHDGEVIEGLIANNPTYVLHPGFYMSPIDPEGNNWLIYVLKNKLKNFQVLGLRPAPKNMPGLALSKAVPAV